MSLRSSKRICWTHIVCASISARALGELCLRFRSGCDWNHPTAHPWVFIRCTWRQPGVLRVRGVLKKYEKWFQVMALCVFASHGCWALLQAWNPSLEGAQAQKWNWWDEKNLDACHEYPKHPVSLDHLDRTATGPMETKFWALRSQRNSFWAVASKSRGGVDSFWFVWHGCPRITAFQNTILCWAEEGLADVERF